MGLELIIFIVAILFGILLYWRESNTNKLYRIINRIVNSKELQMKPDDKTGFVYKQKFIPRLVYITFFLLLIAVILQFVSPINIFGSYDGVSNFASILVGTLLGTYIANFVLKSGKVIDDKSDGLGDLVSDTFEKGKEIIDDITSKNNDEEEQVLEEPKASIDESSEEKKSARDRLKDKGFLK